MREPVRRPRLQVGDLRRVVRLAALGLVVPAQLHGHGGADGGHDEQEQDGERDPALPARTFGERPAGHHGDRMRSCGVVGRFEVERSVLFEIAIVLAVCAGVLGAALLILTSLAVGTILVVVAIAYAWPSPSWPSPSS